MINYAGASTQASGMTHHSAKSLPSLREVWAPGLEALLAL